MRTLILGGLLASAMLVPALAQTSPPPAPPEPAAQSTAPKAHGEMWRSSKLIGLNVYNDQDEKLGAISEILLDKSGKVDFVVIGVGGFLGIGEKEVAVPFEALHATTKNNKTYLVMNTTKDALKSAPGFKYDRSAAKWVPETAK